jgi:hypothetical protein
VANTLTGLVAPVYEALNSVSREFVGFIPQVNIDNGNFASAAVGQTVTSFVVPSLTAVNITPGVTAPNDGDEILNSINMTISKAMSVNIRWNGEEQLSVNNNGPTFGPIVRQQFQQAFRTLVNQVEIDLALQAVTNASRATGTPATAPFGVVNDLSDFAKTLQILDDNGAPANPRALVVNSASMVNLRGKQAVLFRVNESGSNELLRRGTVGEVESFNLGYSAGLKAFTKGTGTSYTANAPVTVGYPVGTTSIALITGSGTVLAGDTVTFAGDTNIYVVSTGVAAPGTIVIAQPGLRIAMAGSATPAMTIAASYTPNIGFSQDALVLATRIPALPVKLDGSRGDMGLHQVILDPFSGIAFDLGLYEQYHQIKFEISLAWGVAAPNPAHIALLYG